MPRLEVCSAGTYEPDLLDAAYEAAGQGSDTFDLCDVCCGDFEGLAGARSDSDPVSTQADLGEAPAWLKLSVQWPAGQLIELRGDVEHPSYEDDDYTCAACGQRLYSDDA